MHQHDNGRCQIGVSTRGEQDERDSRANEIWRMLDPQIQGELDLVSLYKRLSDIGHRGFS